MSQIPETFTRQEVLDLIVAMQATNGRNVFTLAPGKNFGERAESILSAFVQVKAENRNLILSFGSTLRKMNI